MSETGVIELTPSDITKLKVLRAAYWVLVIGLSGVASMPIILVGQIGWASGSGGRAVLANALTCAWSLGYASLALSVLRVSRNIQARRGRMFNLVVTAIAAALCVPFGTIIGVCALIVLAQPRIDAAFRAGDK